jgi:acetyltransferase-like isoleucine patch superfamily enzyme
VNTESERYINLIQKNNHIHETCKFYGKNVIGENCTFLENVTIGYPSGNILNDIKIKKEKIESYAYNGSNIGNNALIRPNSTIYCDVTIGDGLRTGHNILVRESTMIGNNVLVGTNVIIDGNTKIGSNVSIQGNVYIPTNTTIEDNVFLGPCSVLTNDKYPIREKYELKGPILRKGVSVGANSTILPGVELGEGAMVAAGSLVTKDVPAWKLAIGFPAKIAELPDKLKMLNRI